MGTFQLFPQEVEASHFSGVIFPHKNLAAMLLDLGAPIHSLHTPFKSPPPPPVLERKDRQPMCAQVGETHVCVVSLAAWFQSINWLFYCPSHPHEKREPWLLGSPLLLGFVSLCPLDSSLLAAPSQLHECVCVCWSISYIIMMVKLLSPCACRSSSS